MASRVCILLNISSKDDAYETHLELTVATTNRYGHMIKTIRFGNDRSLVDNNITRQIMLDNKITTELTSRENHHRNHHRHQKPLANSSFYGHVYAPAFVSWTRIHGFRYSS